MKTQNINDSLQLAVSHDEIELRFNQKQCSVWLDLTPEEAEILLEHLPEAIAASKNNRLSYGAL